MVSTCELKVTETMLSDNLEIDANYCPGIGHIKLGECEITITLYMIDYTNPIANYFTIKTYIM